MITQGSNTHGGLPCDKGADVLSKRKSLVQLHHHFDEKRPVGRRASRRWEV